MSDKDICIKIFNLTDWRRYEEYGTFSGSEHDLRDGFIHLSYPDQTAVTLSRYFITDTQLVLGRIDLRESDPFYRKERSSGGEIFPHYYTSLKKSQIITSRSLKRAEDTIWDETVINSSIQSLTDHVS